LTASCTSFNSFNINVESNLWGYAEMPIANFFDIRFTTAFSDNLALPTSALQVEKMIVANTTD
jgi:hypothetical protein